MNSLEKTSGYQGKNVLITGHTGFKGSWLAIWLKSLGAKIVGYALKPNTQPNLFDSVNLAEKMKSIIGDIRDENHLTETFHKYKPEFVFHLAAQPIVRDSYENPKYTYETNVIGLVNLFEAIRKTNSVKTVLNITSDKCYANKEWVWGYRENDPLGGDDPYSSSKACSEIITHAYRKSFFSEESKISLASVRAGNVVGGGDWAKDRIVPDSIKALVKGLPIQVRNPSAIRPWQHVLEPLSGYLWLGLLLDQFGPQYASAWNFCPRKNQSITVQKLVEHILEIWGEGSWTPINKAQPQPKETNFLKLDCSKAHHELGWHGLLNIKETITETIKWYKSYYSQNEDIFKLCQNQINDYITLAGVEKMDWVSSLTFDPKQN
jgi:CDP-glucose 4,6-dehydratase